MSTPMIITISVLFVIGGAISQTGLAGSLGNTLLKLAGNSSYKVVITEIHARSYTPLTRNTTVRLPEAGTVLLQDGELYVIGEYEDVLRVAEENGLKFMDEMGGDRERGKISTG